MNLFRLMEVTLKLLMGLSVVYTILSFSFFDPFIFSTHICILDMNDHLLSSYLYNWDIYSVA